MSNLTKYNAFFQRTADFVRKPTGDENVAAYRYAPVPTGFFRRLFAPLPGQFVYVTDGIALREMVVPADQKDIYPARIELIAIAQESIVGAVDGEDIISGVLLFLAHYLRENAVFLGPLHTLDFGQPLCPNSTMSAFFFAVPSGINMKKLCGCTVGAELVVSVIPLSASELAFAKEKGSPALIEKFEQSNVPNFFDPFRKSVV